jgi:hypothetical protein
LAGGLIYQKLIHVKLYQFACLSCAVYRFEGKYIYSILFYSILFRTGLEAGRQARMRASRRRRQTDRKTDRLATGNEQRLAVMTAVIGGQAVKRGSGMAFRHWAAAGRGLQRDVVFYCGPIAPS